MGLASTRIQHAGKEVTTTNRLPVTAENIQYSSAPSSFSILTSGGDVATLAANEKCFVQNLGTNALFVKRGTGASTSSANYVLQACTVNDDGTGGMVEIDDFIGVVSATGTSPRFLAWKA